MSSIIFKLLLVFGQQKKQELICIINCRYPVVSLIQKYDYLVFAKIVKLKKKKHSQLNIGFYITSIRYFKNIFQFDWSN